MGRFHLDWVLSREIAATLQTSTGRAVRVMAASGLGATIESDSARGISAVWRRVDVDTMLNGRANASVQRREIARPTDLSVRGTARVN